MPRSDNDLVRKAMSVLGKRGQKADRDRVGDKEYRRQRSERGRLGGVAARGKSGRKKGGKR